MPSPCYYHPDAPATGNCVQCGVPICDACTDRINQKPVCKNCVAVVRARVERELASAPAGYAAPAVGGQTQINHGSYGVGNAPTSGLPGYGAVPDSQDKSKLVLGIVVASLIGIVAAIAIEKITVYAHFGLSLFYIFMGYGIGWGLHRLTGRGGAGMAALAVGIMVGCLLLSHVIWAQDLLTASRSGPDGDPSLTLGDAFSFVMSNAGFMHWVLIAIGLYACFQGMMRRQ